VNLTHYLHCSQQPLQEVVDWPIVLPVNIEENLKKKNWRAVIEKERCKVSAIITKVIARGVYHNFLDWPWPDTGVLMKSQQSVNGTQMQNWIRLMVHTRNFLRLQNRLWCTWRSSRSSHWRNVCCTSVVNASILICVIMSSLLSKNSTRRYGTSIGAIQWVWRSSRSGTLNWWTTSKWT